MLFRSQGAFVLEQRSVEVLHQESDRVLVRGTIKEGDRIVSSGIHRLVPGQVVRPIGGGVSERVRE